MSYCHGALHPRAKLREEDVRIIRALREVGLSYRAIAKKFEVTSMAVWYVVNYWSWAHLR